MWLPRAAGDGETGKQLLMHMEFLLGVMHVLELDDGESCTTL